MVAERKPRAARRRDGKPAGKTPVIGAPRKDNPKLSRGVPLAPVAEVAALFRAIAAAKLSPRRANLLLFSIAAGARWQAVSALTWADVDLKNKVARIDGRRRPLSSLALSILDKHSAEIDQLRSRRGLVFESVRGGAITSLDRDLKEPLRQLEQPDLTFHRVIKCASRNNTTSVLARTHLADFVAPSAQSLALNHSLVFGA